MARLSAAAILLTALPAFAEERTFTITVDGKPAGELVVGYQSRAEGVTAVTVRGEYRAERPALSFGYHGTESWKDGRATRVEGLGTENATKGGITLVYGTDAYALKAGVKEVRVRDEVWPTTGVMPPDPDRRPLVVDVITGDVLRAKTEKVGPDRVVVAGKAIAVTHYRVIAGPNRWDVWYDEKQRLAKRVWTREGRTVVVAELAQVKSE
jgi:hypothetical protein